MNTHKTKISVDFCMRPVTQSVLLICITLISGTVASSDINTLPEISTPVDDNKIERVQRPMKVNQSTDLGIEIWTEDKPAWTVTTGKIDGKHILLAQTPPNVYPPASMSVTSFLGLQSDEGDFDKDIEVALKLGLSQYGVPGEFHNTLQRENKQYGELTGVEVNFSSSVHETPADVKIFIGKAKNQRPVLLQLYTIEGAMPDLAE